MKLKIRYEDKFQTIELDETATKDLWVSLSLGCDEGITQGEMERRIQDKCNEEINKPEYNIYHRETRYIEDVKTLNHEGEIEVNTEEAIMHHAIDKSMYTASMDELENRLEYEYQYQKYCEWLRSVLKPEQAEMVISIVLKGMSVAEYADLIGDNPNNVSHRYCRVLKKLQKVFKKRPFGLSLVANKYEGDTLNGKGGK